MKDMSNYDMVALGRSLFDAFAAGDLSIWKARLAPDFAYSYPGVPDGKGIEAALEYNLPFNSAFSDWVTEVHAAAIEGDTVFQSVTVQVTHSGPLTLPSGTIPATGKRGAVKAVIVTAITDGLIRHEATYWNVPDLMAQLG